LYYSGERKLRKQCSLFTGEEDIQPGLGEQTLAFFTSLYQIISKHSYIGTNIIMMVSTCCLLSLHNHNKVILCQSHQTAVIVAMLCFGFSSSEGNFSPPQLYFSFFLSFFIQSNQSYSDSRHVKYVISIKCSNIFVQ
jgi:hypothetical protein